MAFVTKKPNDVFNFVVEGGNVVKRTVSATDLQVGYPGRPAELHVTGKFSQSIKTIAAVPKQTIEYDDSTTILCVKAVNNAKLSGSITVLLPKSPRVGQLCYVKDASGTSNSHNVIVKSEKSLIDGSSSKILKSPYDSSSFVWTGESWTALNSSGTTVVVQGTQGPQGERGTRGMSGERGISFYGSQGTQGSQGYQGSIGTTGPQGSIGLTGLKGEKGDIGPMGSTGPIGPQGSQGNTGATGASGLQGSQGAQGAQGSTGEIGPAGPRGFQGFQGFQGRQGVVGSQGHQGNVGPQGTQGPQGETGASGLTGPQGAQGSIGLQGPQGLQGYQGEVPTAALTTVAWNFMETPSGNIDGINVAYALSSSPYPEESLMLFINGVLQVQPVDYVLSGSLISLTQPIWIGSKIVATYSYKRSGNSIAWLEQPIGLVDGVNSSFDVQNTPNPSNSLMVFVNGILQLKDADYTLTGKTITFYSPPYISDNLAAIYSY